MPNIGLSLKPQHFSDVLELESSEHAGLWWEVHPENYYVEGGPRLAALAGVRESYPISLHSVSLNLGGIDPINIQQVRQLRRLAQRFEVVRVSDHLAWQTHEGRYFPDLLPIVRNTDSLQHIASRIVQCQDALGTTIAVENPSHYLPLAHELSEQEFLKELVQRSGCALLLDVNNVAVSAHNLKFDAHQYLSTFPLEYVSELHLAGYQADENPNSRLLIDSHDAPVSEAVLQLYVQVLRLRPELPCLIERDGNIPVLAELLAERMRVETLQ